MDFLPLSRIYSHKTYESILSLPFGPLLTKGLAKKKHEGRTSFKEALDKSGLIIKGCSFPSSFDPLKEIEDIDSLDFEDKLYLLSSYHHTYSRDSAIFNAGLNNGNINLLISSLKKEAKSLILEETDDMVYEYAFIDKGLLQTDLIELSLDIALMAFKGKNDRAMVPYVYHPVRVATRCGDDEYAIAAALLHDVVEDAGNDFGYDYLEEKGIPSEVIEAVRLLTHEKGVPYLAYVDELSKNEIARKVKIGDVLDNLNEARNGMHSRKSLYYFKSLSLLERYPDFSDEATYYYSINDDIFFKKDTHNHWVLKEGKFIDSGSKLDLDDLLELTFYPGDECVKKDILPYFLDGVLKINL